MTLAQELRTTGFRVALGVRGTTVLLGDKSFTALLEHSSPDQLQTLPDREVAAADRIHILRSDLDDATVTAIEERGATFVHQETGRRLRVTEVDDNPVNVSVVFNVEVA